MYNLYYLYNYPIRSYIEKFIENCQIGDPMDAAYCMVYYCGSDRRWAEEFISNCKIGNPTYAATLMVRDCGSNEQWAINVIKNYKEKIYGN